MAGASLRQLRVRARLTTREVAELSRKIALAEGNEEFSISHARMVQIENGESTPSIYKLYSLSAIYGTSFNGVASLFVNLPAITKYRFGLGLANTRLADFSVNGEERPVSFPVRFDPGFSVDKTNLLSRMVEVWGEAPASLLARLNLRKARYGFIGLTDYTMYPLLRPASFVQVEEQAIPSGPVAHHSEFDRPIWFLELRDGYVCSWCEFQRDRVICIPHPLSPCHTRELAYPRDVDIVGRVTAVAARLVNHLDPAAPRSAESPGQS